MSSLGREHALHPNRVRVKGIAVQPILGSAMSRSHHKRGSSTGEDTIPYCWLFADGTPMMWGSGEYVTIKQ